LLHALLARTDLCQTYQLKTKTTTNLLYFTRNKIFSNTEIEKINAKFWNTETWFRKKRLRARTFIFENTFTKKPKHNLPKL